MEVQIIYVNKKQPLRKIDLINAITTHTHTHHTPSISETLFKKTVLLKLSKHKLQKLCYIYNIYNICLIYSIFRLDQLLARQMFICVSRSRVIYLPK